MTLPTLWIRQNMLQSPGPARNNNERQLTEAEMKVQRSLKKLSIPEWYLNNSSHPPKILMNDTPIELRPPSWKGQSAKKTAACSTPVMSARNSTVNRDGLLETEIGPSTLPDQSYGTFRINRNSAEKSPTSKKQASPQKNQSREKKSSKSRLMNVSRTFPRVSPSRKIQNINLVFSQPPKSHSHTITDLDISDPTIDMSDDSLESQIIEPTIQTPASMMKSLMITDLDASETELNMIQDSLAFPSTKSNRRLQTPPISSATCKITDIDEPESETIENNISSSKINQDTDFMNQTFETSKINDASFNSTFSATRVSKLPNQKLTYIKPWTKPEITSCVTPEGKFLNGTSFKLRASSTPQGSPVSLFSASAIENTSRTICKEQPTSGLSILPSKNTEKSPPSQRVMKPKIQEEEICEACKADPSRARNSPPPNNRLSNGFRPRNLLPSIGETPSNSEKSTSPTPSEAFLTSKKKSSELESIIKRKQQPGKSLVQEIIEELNEKCRTSAQPTYVSPGSKNFVKKLVRALEKGKTCVGQKEPKDVSYYRYPNYENYEDEENLEDDVFVESETGSEDEIKSAAVSTSLSYKDTTDSSSNASDSDLNSPTIKLDYEYDWNMNMEKNRNETMTMKSVATSTPETAEKDNDSVYWIPVAKTKLPRTSSLVSMMSRLSSSNATQQSPCVSPITQANDAKTFTWGRTYRTNERTRTLRRIDEITVLDSGYEDRSRIHSSESSDDTWFDDSDSTWTASESGSNVSFSLGSRLRRERKYGGEIHGRPFII